MISRAGRGSRGRAIEPKTCSNPANGLPGTALIPCVAFLFFTRGTAGFCGLAEVAVDMEKTVGPANALTSRQKQLDVRFWILVNDSSGQRLSRWR